MNREEGVSFLFWKVDKLDTRNCCPLKSIIYNPAQHRFELWNPGSMCAWIRASVPETDLAYWLIYNSGNY